MRVEGCSNSSATERPASALRARGRLLERERAVEHRGQLVGRELVAGDEVARQGAECTVRCQVRVLTWNLFHGRSVPSAGRDLLNEFAARLNGWAWDVALLQEVPPWWPPLLARACGAEHRLVLTSRNSLLPLRRAISSRNPDLLKSNGGGCNAILVRGGGGGSSSRRPTAWRCGRSGA